MGSNTVEYTISDVTTEAIQSAIDACAITGGRVIIPEGEYLIGTIRLRSGVELHLSKGARLIASGNFDDYNALDEYPQNFSVPSEGWGGYHLILGVEVENIAITGDGIIDGNADRFFGEVKVDPVFYPWRKGMARLTEKMRPGQLVCLVESKNVTLRDFTILNTPAWACHIHGCDDVTVENLKIESSPYHLNTDGIDIDSSRRVAVTDCTIRVGDDALAVRGSAGRLNDKGRNCESVTVRRCTLSSSSSAVRIGVGQSEIKDLDFSDITIESAGIGINFYPEWADISHTPIIGAKFRNIRASDVGRMIELNVKNATRVEDIGIFNVKAEAMSAVRMRCGPRGAVSGITLENIEVRAVKDTTSVVSERPEYRDAGFVMFDGIEKLELRDCRFAIPDELKSDFKESAELRNCGVTVADYHFLN